MQCIFYRLLFLFFYKIVKRGTKSIHKKKNEREKRDMDGEIREVGAKALVGDDAKF